MRQGSGSVVVFGYSSLEQNSSVESKLPSAFACIDTVL